MEIILKEDIIGLGFKNDIVNVKSGYGRNYLIPQGKGVIASPSAKKILAENLKQQAHKLAALKAAAEGRPLSSTVWLSRLPPRSVLLVSSTVLLAPLRLPRSSQSSARRLIARSSP